MTYPSSGAINGAADDGSLEALLTNGDKTQEVPDRESATFLGPRPSCVLVLLLFLASTFFALWINAIRNPCPLDPLLAYSPVNEAVVYVESRFDGSTNATSIFRGHPSPGIDAAWTRVSIDAKATRLTREQFLMTGGNDSTAAVKYRPDDGGGYMSQVDGYHHVHCLDLLRKYLRQEYYVSFDPSFNHNLRPHLGHCVEIIRQKLMCTSDLTMISYERVSSPDPLRPNLSAMHQCVDYEQILNWSDEHNAHVLKDHVVMFGDATELAEDPM